MEKTLKIGIDIDNTLVCCKSFLYNLTAKLKFSSIKHNLKFVEIQKQQEIKRTKGYLFLQKMFKFFNPDAYEIFPQAIETLNYFQEKGYEVQLITSRPNMSCFVTSLKELLIKHNVPYDKLIAGCNNKPLYVQQNNIDILIDDLPKNCKEVEYLGKKSICFQATLKEDKKLKKFTGISSVSSTWSNVLTFVEEYINTPEDFLLSEQESNTTFSINIEWQNEIPKDFINPFQYIKE